MQPPSSQVFFMLGKSIVLFLNQPRFCWHVRRIQKSVPDAILLIFGRTGAMPGTPRGGGGGDSAYERGGDARWKFWIKTPKGDQSGRGSSFFWPLKETMLKHRQYMYLYICVFLYICATLNETSTAKYYSVLPRTPQVRPKSEIFTP